MLSAQSADPTVRQAALGKLCEYYWTPLYAFLRRRGLDEHDAMDLVQGFVTQLLESDGVRSTAPDKGRFRNYLIGALVHYVSKQRRGAMALKRGGATSVFSFDAVMAEQQYQCELASMATPQRAFDRQFALALLDRCLARLRADYARRGREGVFLCLAPYLGARPAAGDYCDAARQLGIQEVAVKVTVHRMRDRLRRDLLDEVAQTLADPGETEAELAELFAALEKP